MKYRILVASSSLLALPSIVALQDRDDLELIGVLSTPDRPKGRHGTPTPNDLVDALRVSDLAIHKPGSDSELASLISAIRPDLVLVIAYGRLIKSDSLSLVPFGWINLHFSLLPHYRGAAPIQRSLLAREKKFGVSLFRIDEGMDTGPIIVQDAIEVSDGQSATEILEMMAQKSVTMVIDGIHKVLSGATLKPQEGEASYAPKIEKHELRLGLERSGDEVIAQIRAFTKTPGVWFLFNDRRHIITSAHQSDFVVEKGKILCQGGMPLLGTNGKAIVVESLIPEGKREMTGEEWMRGLRLREGETSSHGVSS